MDRPAVDEAFPRGDACGDSTLILFDFDLGSVTSTLGWRLKIFMTVYKINCSLKSKHRVRNCREIAKSASTMH